MPGCNSKRRLGLAGLAAAVALAWLAVFVAPSSAEEALAAASSDPAAALADPIASADPEPPPARPLSASIAAEPSAPVAADLAGASAAEGIADPAAGVAEAGPGSAGADQPNPNAAVIWGESPDAAHATGKPVAVQIGMASWYGDDFHGLTTASGEVYDMHASTVAHPSWPLGAVVRVQNLRNGRSTLARINDRGPYAHGRILDCSFAIAELLGFVNRGATEVQITLLDAGSDAWTRFGTELAPSKASPKAPQPIQVAVALATVEDTAPVAPALVPAAAPEAAAAATRPALRTASVLPLPAIVHAWHGLYGWLFASHDGPSRWTRLEDQLDRCGLRTMLLRIVRL